MKKILLITTIIAFAICSCKKDITGLNVDTKDARTVPAEALFANAQKKLSDLLASTDVNTNIFRLIMQQWTQTTYTDESNYNMKTRQIPDRLFQTLYRDVLKNLQGAKSIIANDALKSTDVKANQLAIADIMQVYAYHMLVNTFGNVPYTEALNYTNITPKYDDAKTIELDLLKRLKDDVATLNANSTASSYDGSDLIYGGNVAKWIKFGNTLMLKLAMLLADVDNANAQTYVTAAVATATGGVFTSNSDNALFGYMSATPNTNPLWVDLFQSGRADFVASKTIVDMMNGSNDPRRPMYFTQVGGVYTGGENGKKNDYSSFSAPSNLLSKNPILASVFLDYAETAFLLAEAAERGLGGGAGAAGYYNNGVKASIEYWYDLANKASMASTSPADATTAYNAYIILSSVAYTSLPAGGYKQKIGEQKYIALYNRGFDAWTEWRRLGYPALTKATNALSEIPLRFTYPIKEQNLNGANYSQAAAAIGGDVVTTKLFWK